MPQHTLLKLLFTSVLALTAATGLTAAAQDGGRAYRDLAGRYLQKPYFTSPYACHDGWAAEAAGYIVAVEPWAERAGIKRGDALLSIGGKHIGQDWEEAMPRTRPSSGAFSVDVDRSGQRVHTEIPCIDHRPYLEAQRELLEAIRAGDWQLCELKADALQAFWAAPLAGIENLRRGCLIQQVNSDRSRKKLPALAEVTHRYCTRSLAELSFVPDGVATERTEILAGIADLERIAPELPAASTYANDIRQQFAAALTNGRQSASNSPSPASPTPPVPTSASGTAFIVDQAGLLLTAHHVVDGATSITVKCQGTPIRQAVIQGKAPLVDLALLKADGPSLGTSLRLATSGSASLGQRVMTIGFPVPDLLGAEPKYSEGTVSSTNGPDGDASFLQISVPIQPGNSGGPLLDETGQVIGIVVSSAAPAAFLKNTGTLPQNINWAVKAALASPLLPTSQTVVAPTPVTDRTRAISAATAATCLVVATKAK